MGTLASVPSSNWFVYPDTGFEQDWLIPYAAVSGAIGVEVGDLMYDYGSSLDVAYPAGQQVSGGSESADQATFAANFCGCSIDKVLSAETNARRRLVVRTTGIKVFDCPSQAWAKGALVGIYSDGVNSPVSQKVDAAADVSHAIGVVVVGTLGVAVTQVTVLFTAKNYVGAKSSANSLSAVTLSSIASTASTLPINGVAAAQGGSVTITGGTSSTAGNAGGAVAMVGGTPGSTGVGGAATITAGPGGSASGNGGAASLVGGAGTAGNGAGGASLVTGGAGQGTGVGGAVTITGGASGAGATGNGGAANITGGAALSSNGNGGLASLVGGLGTGTGAGGAITITSGAAGSTGVAGAVNISVGAATAGVGSALTLTAGNGAGSTNGGGIINLIPGTAVSTGTPGEVQVNSVAGLFEVVYAQGVTAAPTTSTSYTLFMANRAYRVKYVSAIAATAGGSGCTVQPFKDTGTTAPGGGTALTTAALSLSGTLNTRVSGTPAALVATCTLAAGDRISLTYAGTISPLAGLVVSIGLVPC